MDMNQAHTQRLFEDFSSLFRGKDLPLTQNLMGFGFECGDGWYDLVYKLAADITTHSRKKGLDPIAMQVKEKFGGLRFYLHGADDYIFELIARAERRSLRICDVCGAGGKQLSLNGWISTRCTEHSQGRGLFGAF